MFCKWHQAGLRAALRSTQPIRSMSANGTKRTSAVPYPRPRNLPYSSPHLVQLRGALMRRLDRGTRCGACGSCRNKTFGRHRGPPGTMPTKLRCQELADVLMLRYRPLAYLSADSKAKARPAAEKTPQIACACRCFSAFFDALSLRCLSACGAPRGARRIRQRRRTPEVCAFRRASPLILRRAAGPSRRIGLAL